MLIKVIINEWRIIMAKFLIKASYSADAWASQIENPQNRIEIVGNQMAAMGCNLIQGYLTFGDSDLIVILHHSY